MSGPEVPTPDRLSIVDRREAQAPPRTLIDIFHETASRYPESAAIEDPAGTIIYSELVTDARLRKRIFSSIEAEWLRTTEALAQITEESDRLASNPALARSIRHRFPYIDPLHHLQVELVRRWRTGQTDERLKNGIHISINGIAAGLRNTG